MSEVTGEVDNRELSAVTNPQVFHDLKCAPGNWHKTVDHNHIQAAAERGETVDHELVELRPSCTQIINPAVLHAEKTADTGLDEAATERRLIDHHEDVQGVAVLGQS